MKPTIKNISKQKSKKSKKPSRSSNVAVVAQEIKFARLLAGNEKRQRDRVLTTLKKWLSTCFKNKYDFKEDDFTRVWKGLFYAIWMSDKPLVQEELCENISGILDEFPAERVSSASLMMGAGLKVLAQSWFGIDQHRIDKFLMFVRRLLRAWFRVLMRAEWSRHSCEINTLMLSGTDGLLASETPRYARNALSLQMHLTECYLEELAKVSQGEMSESSVVEMTRPFAVYMSRGGEKRLLTCIKKNIFKYLIRQTELGIEYEERRQAWSQMGCPPGGPDALLLDEDSDDEEEADSDEDRSPALDPRAGRVDVALSSLPVSASRMISLLTDLQKTTSGTAYTRLKECRSWFEQLSEGVYPFRVATDEAAARQLSEPDKLPSKMRAALEMQAFDDALVADSDELDVRGLNKKLRKRVLAQRRAALLSGHAVAADTTTSGNWTVERAEPEPEPEPEQVTKQPRPKRKRAKENDNIKNNKKPKQLTDKPVRPQSVNKKTRQNNKLQPADLTKKEKKPTTKKEKAVNNVIVIKQKAKNYQKQTSTPTKEVRSPTNQNNHNVSVDSFNTQKRVKFALKNNSMQATVDYYHSLLRSPNIPFDASKKPNKTNLKPNSTPSPINPFFKKKLNLKRPPFHLP